MCGGNADQTWLGAVRVCVLPGMQFAIWRLQFSYLYELRTGRLQCMDVYTGIGPAMSTASVMCIVCPNSCVYIWCKCVTH